MLAFHQQESSPTTGGGEEGEEDSFLRSQLRFVQEARIRDCRRENALLLALLPQGSHQHDEDNNDDNDNKDDGSDDGSDNSSNTLRQQYQ